MFHAMVAKNGKRRANVVNINVAQELRCNQRNMLAAVLCRVLGGRTCYVCGYVWAVCVRARTEP